jgi:hypothetical protein
MLICRTFPMCAIFVCDLSAMCVLFVLVFLRCPCVFGFSMFSMFPRVMFARVALFLYVRDIFM